MHIGVEDQNSSALISQRKNSSTYTGMEDQNSSALFPQRNKTNFCSMLPWHQMLLAQGVSPKHFCSRVGYFGLCICPSTQGVYVICLWVCMTHAVSPKTILPLMLLQALVYPTRWTSAAVSNFCCGKYLGLYSWWRGSAGRVVIKMTQRCCKSFGKHGFRT